MIRELAPAKINLFLQVHGKREDGYHQVSTVYQEVSLYDELELTPANHGIQISCDAPGLPGGPENLAYRAAELLLPIAPGGVCIRLKKVIPWQAGLGGGSSDAAAVLRGLNKLWGLRLSLAELAELASKLGSDVPFFLLGGTALGTGRGELIEPLARIRRLDLMLVKPPFGLSTPLVYKAYRPTYRETPTLEEFMGVLADGQPETIGRYLRNDLEDAACQLRPELARLKERLLKQGALGCLVSGSGSSVFAVLPQNYEATYWTQVLPVGYQAFFTHA